ncbi:MAG: hypothetical protein IPQ17_06030 [Xanthomonadales bacterium]|uniref:hypothetical protein n=1 Tax=Dokdonella sp. TaxID=2291710 RepID=UPI002BD4E874|nr:hypothetical protein [Xanthomonadales bacterium]HQV71466.1 hypothetical protein [Dokdonella sp.]HQY54672.1 hypothetical protein [Dokdonella sp.]HQZ61682.1 hypothetical protein [Dokdonella sp.]
MDIRTARMLTLVLAAICGLLVVTALIQLAGYGRGYGWLPADAADEGLRVAEVDQTPLKIPPMSSFAEVENRPLFNEDRKPTPLGDDAPATEGPPPVALNVTLTGVIIVRASGTRPELRIAMLRDNMRNESLTLKVGMPLTGDQAGWTLEALEPRLATFRNANDEKAEIELTTTAAPARAPAPAAANARPASAPAEPSKQANEAASDLAKRIEERRRQMREEAERLRSQRGNSPTGQKN